MAAAASMAVEVSMAVAFTPRPHSMVKPSAMEASVAGAIVSSQMALGIGVPHTPMK
jgi:hypothetical protein